MFANFSDAKSAQSAEAQMQRTGRDVGFEVISGTSYNNLGGKRRGLASAMDTNLVQQNLENRLARYGEGGYTIAVLDANGNKKPNSTLEIDGKIFKSRADGSHHIVDNSFIEVIERESEQQEEYIRNIVRKVAKSDRIGAHILGLGLDFFLSLCAPKGITNAGYYKDIFGADPTAFGDSDLDKFNCKPSFLQVLSQDSSVFAGAISKLKAICMAFTPILQDCTPDGGVQEHTAEPKLDDGTKAVVLGKKTAPKPATSPP